MYSHKFAKNPGKIQVPNVKKGQEACKGSSSSDLIIYFILEHPWVNSDLRQKYHNNGNSNHMAYQKSYLWCPCLFERSNVYQQLIMCMTQ